MNKIICFYFINVILILLLTSHISYSAEDVQESETGTIKIIEDPSSLIDQARILKSKKRFGEAIKLLRRAEELASSEKDIDINIEIATILSWEHKYQESIDMYKKILDEYPGNSDARFGLARAYSWAGMYDSAISEYSLILKNRPDDPEARIGISRILSWQGRLDEAIDVYRSVLINHPDNNDARLGLANVMLWRGDLKGSLEETRYILLLRPDNREALKLEMRLREEKGPSAFFFFSSSFDSDSNNLVVYKTNGYANLNPYIRLNVDYTIFEAARKDDNGFANIFSIRDSLHISRKVSITPRLSIVNINSDINDTKYAAGGISARWGLLKEGSLFLSYSYSPLVDTVQLMRNDIRVQEYSTSVLFNAGDISISARTSYGEYSDNNSRYDFTSDIAWTIDNEPEIIAGYILDYKDFEKTPYNGYFSPDDFISMRVYLTLSGDIYTDKIEYNTKGSIGMQRHESKTEDTSFFQAKIIGHLNRYLSMDGGYKWSRSSLEAPSGYRFVEYRFGLTYVY